MDFDDAPSLAGSVAFPAERAIGGGAMRIGVLAGGIGLALVLVGPAFAENNIEEGIAKAKHRAEREHVDICDELGLSGLTISSDDNCLVISGAAAYQYEFGNYNSDQIRPSTPPTPAALEDEEIGSFTIPAGGDSDFGPATASIKLHPVTPAVSAGITVYGGMVAPGTVTFTTPDDLS